MDESLLKISNLYGGYTKDDIIKNISLEIKKGEFLGIIGPNGAGKSTLLKLLSRVLIPRSGQVNLEENNIHQMKLKDFCRKIAFVPQDTMINFSFSVEEIVLMGRIPHLKRLQFETKKDLAIVQEALVMTDTLGLKDRYIENISSGERQRVWLAKALAQEPILLFLDEPTAHLDIGHQIQILDLLNKLNRKTSLTIIIVLHDLNLASEYCSRLVLLNDGQIFAQGLAQEVLTYQNIENVYQAIVVVNKNPISLKPFVISISKEKCVQN
jgi:iron complex transport system ATP-binding protein